MQAPVVEKNVPHPQKAAPPQRPKRLFLRVPDQECEQYRKAENLTQIFEGGFPVVFYDSSTKQYDFEHPGIALSDYLLAQFRDLLGAENVILK